MPYPNFHTAVISSRKFSDYRRSKDFFQKQSNNRSDKGIDVLFGIANGKSEIASIYFDKKIWNVEQAKTWLKDHKQEVMEFEPALTEDATPVASVSAPSITTSNTGDVYAYKPKVLPTIARFGIVGPPNTEGEPKKKKKYKMFMEQMEEYLGNKLLIETKKEIDCPRCKGLKQIEVNSFSNPSKTIKKSCHICKGSGKLKLNEAKGKKLDFYGKDYMRTLEREDLETTLFELADVLSNYDQSKAEVQKVMYKQIDIENIRHYKDDDLINAYISLVKIAKKYDIKNECLK